MRQQPRVTDFVQGAHGFLRVAAGLPGAGAPGERPHYHPGYYGAYVADPDGNNVEAVFHDRPAG